MRGSRQGCPGAWDRGCRTATRRTAQSWRLIHGRPDGSFGPGWPQNLPGPGFGLSGPVASTHAHNPSSSTGGFPGVPRRLQEQSSGFPVRTRARQGRLQSSPAGCGSSQQLPAPGRSHALRPCSPHTQPTDPHRSQRSVWVGVVVLSVFSQPCGRKSRGDRGTALTPADPGPPDHLRELHLASS